MRILFNCLNHQINGPRLYYRQARTIQKQLGGSEIYFLTTDYRKEMGLPTTTDDSDINVLYCPSIKTEIITNKSDSVFTEIGKKIKRRVTKQLNKLKFSFQSYKMAYRADPDVLQASDITEIPMALTMRMFTGCRIIYDAHEDYFNFFYEFSGKSKKGLIKAMWYTSLEWLTARFFDGVFCTDDYLYRKYSKWGYGIKKLHLLRNFPNMEYVKKTCDYSKKDELDLVYIGSFNQFRGIIETADYVEHFNDKFAGRRSLNFDVFCANFSIIERLSAEGKINHKGSIKYAPLMKKIADYDIGTCLLLPIKKYKRNISMKNFEYMSVGLPVLTSNFGQCKKYIDRSGAGICIDPKSYWEFEKAMLDLFDENLRKELGEAGRRFCGQKGSFEKEAQPYIEQLQNFAAQA